MTLNNQKKEIINLYLANPRGFCAGVDRAIKMVEKSIKLFGKPVYVRHEIVHNRHVVDRLKKLGAIFVDELNEIPNNNYEIKIFFSGDNIITLISEAVEVIMHDLGKAWKVQNIPKHRI